MKNARTTLFLLLAFSVFFTLNSHSAAPDFSSSLLTHLSVADTVPHQKPAKKDSVKKPATTPYDSFGKPKKMDTTVLH